MRRCSPAALVSGRELAFCHWEGLIQKKRTVNEAEEMIETHQWGGAALFSFKQPVTWYHVVQAGLELLVLLVQPPKC